MSHYFLASAKRCFTVPAKRAFLTVCCSVLKPFWIHLKALYCSSIYMFANQLVLEIWTNKPCSMCAVNQQVSGVFSGGQRMCSQPSFFPSACCTHIHTDEGVCSIHMVSLSTLDIQRGGPHIVCSAWIKLADRQ